MGRLLHSAAGKVADAKSMAEFCSALVKCRDMLDSRFANRESFMECLKSRLSEKAGCLDGNSALRALPERFNSVVRLYKDAAACLMYFAFKVGYCASVPELSGQLDDLISLLRYRTTEPKTDVLDEAEISLLLELLQDKFNFLDAVTYEKRIEIYLINRSHLCFDSWLMTFKNTYTGKWVNKWMVMSFSPCLDTPLCGKYFVFLHEMGHILYNEITDGGAAVPELFRELPASVPGMPALADEDKLPELFSDLFAAAAMNGSRYAAHNPYSAIFPEELIRLFEEYFTILVSRVGSGYYNIWEKRVLH